MAITLPVIALLVACVPADKPESVAAIESGSEDTEPSEDSAPDSHDETGTHTAVETDETGDQLLIPPWAEEPIHPDWRGGDPVPGWDDRPCPYWYGPDVVHLAYHVVSYSRSVVGWYSGEPGTSSLMWLDYVAHDTDAEDEMRPDFLVAVHLFQSLDAPGDGRGVGWYLPRYGTRTISSQSAVTPFGDLRPVDDLHTGGTACLRYVGPDRMAGSLYMAPYAPPGQTDGRSPYPVVTWVIELEFLYAEHAGTSFDFPLCPSAYSNVMYAEGTPYNRAWPWESITDPGIRSAMFWRYMPTNDPRYPESLRRTGVHP